MIDRSVADKLKIGLEIEPESFDSVTVYFSDITGFQTLAVECSPFQVRDLSFKQQSVVRTKVLKRLLPADITNDVTLTSARIVVY